MDTTLHQRTQTTKTDFQDVCRTCTHAENGLKAAKT
jgi:hypothetical protein